MSDYIYGDALRQIFQDYFLEKGHHHLSSSSLVPEKDSSLLFINAGMAPLKEYFLDKHKAPHSRAVSIQRCLRAGGKHNDLENVGYTERHHTFFEMMGNFSWADYFKREAIHYAWEFLTQHLKIPKDRLWVTVYKKDTEAAKIWLDEVGVDPQRFSYCGFKDNFWLVGETGPCGPCSELFYDWGPHYSGDPPGLGVEGDRYIELWNLVFMQYQRTQQGELLPLPKPAIDTGMGLERISAVMQGVHSNYGTDLFQPLLQAASDLAGCSSQSNPRLKILADHIRACTFLIADGVLPSNEGRGYVVRRILRRALRSGYQLGLSLPFFYQLVPPTIAIMRHAYPYLHSMQAWIQQVIRQEEEQFSGTLQQGLHLFNRSLENLKDTVIPGEIIFYLYDTYGFPVDLTADMAREKGLRLDLPGFEAKMEVQRQQSKAGSHFIGEAMHKLSTESCTRFTGYERLVQTANVIALIQDDKKVDRLIQGEQGMIVLDHSPFYAEAGGQVSDQGWLRHEDTEFFVQDTQKQGDYYFHKGQIRSGSFTIGMQVEAFVDQKRRIAIACNHTATHLLHAALHRIVGERAIQKGSLVTAERLRFDFSSAKALTHDQCRTIEQWINQQICANLRVTTSIMSLTEAKQRGALAVFGEKYSDPVRVLTIGDISQELCGGTHATRTGDIGLFKITQETAVAANIRRIEAVTGEYALHWISELEQRIEESADLLQTTPKHLIEKIKKCSATIAQLETQNKILQRQLVDKLSAELLPQAVSIQNISLITALLQDVAESCILSLLDQLKRQLKTGVIVLAHCVDQRVHWIIGVTKNSTDKFKACELLQELMRRMNGKGGGGKDFAKGVSAKFDDMQAELAWVSVWMRSK